MKKFSLLKWKNHYYLIHWCAGDFDAPEQQHICEIERGLSCRCLSCGALPPEELVTQAKLIGVKNI